MRTALAEQGDAAQVHHHRQQQRIDEFTRRRARLTDAYLADAIPVDVLKDKQEAIVTELLTAQAELESDLLAVEEIETRLEQALTLLRDPERAYRATDNEGRRHFNQAFFNSLAVDHEGVVGADLADPFAQLLTEDLAEQIERETASGTLHSVDGSKETTYVGAEGLEPPTPSL